MMNNDDKSYERYKQYRLNKYRYEQEQKMLPIAIIVWGVILSSLWKYIMIAILASCVLAAIVAAIYIYLKKQLQAQQAIVISKEDAKEGIEAKITVIYDSRQTTFVFSIPPNVKDGQKFIAKNILFENRKGKKIKKNVHFKVQVL